MSYFIQIQSRTVGAYTKVTLSSTLSDTLLDSKELHLLKDELEYVLEEVTAMLPEEDA